jgi:DNA-binding transcriptional ArsR family regulator
MSPELLEPRSASAFSLLSALANQKRLMIMAHLFDKEISVNNLAILVKLSQSALSQHLSRLRKADLVHSRREGQTIYYSAQNNHKRQITETICKAFVAGQ